jgi:hypothetical protein
MALSPAVRRLWPLNTTSHAELVHSMSDLFVGGNLGSWQRWEFPLAFSHVVFVGTVFYGK